MSIDEKEEGVIFDQYYTHSFLRHSIKKRGYKLYSEDFNLNRAFPKEQVFLPLLLFHKAYIVKPYWLLEESSKEIEQLRNEELIDWIPPTYLDPSLKKVRLLMNKQSHLSKFFLSMHGDLSLEDLSNPQSEYERRYRDEQELEYSDLEKDIRGLDKEFRYFDPMLRSALDQCRRPYETLKELTSLPLPPAERFEDFSDSRYILRFDFSEQFPDAESTKTKAWREYERLEKDHWLKESRSSFQVDLINDKSAFQKFVHEEVRSSPFDLGEQEALHEVQWYWDDALSRRALFDACASVRMIEKFASGSKIPVCCAHSKSPSFTSKQLDNDITLSKDSIHGHLGLIHNDAYQLFQIQLNEVKYPKIRNINDVLRLRDSKHLNSYRHVIQEYSERLRNELEKEKFKIFDEFRKDLRLAERDLSWVTSSEYYWNRFSFFIALPLAIVGAFQGIPWSDFFSIGVAGPWRMINSEEKEKLDWFLFGRPR